MFEKSKKNDPQNWLFELEKMLKKIIVKNKLEKSI